MFEIIEEDGDVGLFCELYVHCESYDNPLVELGSGDEARTNARELLAVLDAWLRPWTTDGSVPHGADVELLLVNGSVGQGYLAGDDWWLDRGKDKIPLAPDQVRGWRYMAPIKIERGRIVEDDSGQR